MCEGRVESRAAKETPKPAGESAVPMVEAGSQPLGHSRDRCMWRERPAGGILTHRQCCFPSPWPIIGDGKRKRGGGVA